MRKELLFALLCALLIVGAYYKGRSDGTLRVEYRAPDTPWADHVSAFCIGCKTARGGAIYAGVVVPGDNGWNIHDLSVDMRTKEIGCNKRP